MSRTVDNLLTLAQVDEGRLELLPRRVRLDEASRRPSGRCGRWLRRRGSVVEVEGDALRGRGRRRSACTQALDQPDRERDQVHPAGRRGPRQRLAARRRGRRDRRRTTARESRREDREHVFDRFFRVDRARGREVGGSGLGLAICREIAIAHGGRVWVESEDGKGSAFSVALPDRVRILPPALGPAGVR